VKLGRRSEIQVENETENGEYLSSALVPIKKNIPCDCGNISKIVSIVIPLLYLGGNISKS
jgi:hypothetical protein